MQWDVYDYGLAALLIGGTLGLYIVLRSVTPNKTWRRWGAVTLLGLLGVVWAQLAVGIIHV